MMKDSKTNESSGFAIWYINSQKPLQETKGNLFGFKGDYAGLGIFVFKDQQGNWVVHGNFNRGMQEYRIQPENLSDLNACTIVGDAVNVVRGIR